MKIRPLSHHDLPTILEIQNSCPQAATWKAADYEQLTRNPQGLVLVAEVEDAGRLEVAGFAAFRRVGEESELWNLAVRPQDRRRGIAKALWQQARGQLAQVGVTRVFLEVRATNTPALEFYRVAGFKPLARRKQYYQNPDEDAVVLSTDLA